ncbi:30S ribosomal protein S9 [Candidatus Babeliales bacterium]|nr:30S ribosomal protein S9 [Candidatus Babeliales bacterium]
MKKAIGTALHGVGRRKSSVARVWLKAGSGEIKVNGKSAKEYFPTDAARDAVTLPFRILSVGCTFDVKANVHGGGVTGQSEAIKLGISRALLLNDETLRKQMREFCLITVDSRVKERKKYGQKAARRKFQFVKR